MVKVLIVDDSALIRTVVKDILEEDGDIKVVGIARNGKEALEKIPLLKPDIITLDIEMPVLDGIETLKEINKKYNIPVLMLSSLTTKDAKLTLKALELGAVDFVTKPDNVFGIGSEEIKNKLIEKVKVVSKSKNINSFKSYGKWLDNNGVGQKTYKLHDKDYETIIAIGTSTGGPRALQEIIPKIPPNINATLVVVQHMPKGFTKSLADRLNSLSKIIVKEGENGEILKRGYCYIAPGDYHMNIVKNGGKPCISLNREPPVSGLRPTVDIMMKSVSRLNDYKKIGIILTGMGSDGTEGIEAIKKKNGFTIAEDESTSIVFGMPRAAINNGNIDKVLPINKIADEIINRVGG